MWLLNNIVNIVSKALKIAIIIIWFLAPCVFSVPVPGPAGVATITEFGVINIAIMVINRGIRIDDHEIFACIPYSSVYGL